MTRRDLAISIVAVLVITAFIWAFSYLVSLPPDSYVRGASL